ncbi:MAG: lipoprotein [Gammaproteobacteria bacterium]|nr:lipoprotein [Gammaproteobacteria bacterium]
MRATLVPLLLCIVLLAGLSACGNKGPLTLPEEDEKSKQTG